jgi:hypothetical protein
VKETEEQIVAFWFEEGSADKACNAEEIGADGHGGQDEGQPEKGAMPGAGESKEVNTTEPFNPK